MTKQQMQNRNTTIALTALYEPELTLEEVGVRYRMTKQRVSQILQKQDIHRGIIERRHENHERLYQEACKAEKAQFATIVSGGRQRPEYRVYANMLRRCLSPRCPSYKRYGGRGISVCDKWRGNYGFQSFLRDVGLRPEARYASGRAKYSLHRIDNDGNYEPGNCKWATQKEQCANRRKPQRTKKMGYPIVGVESTQITGQQAYL